MGFISFYLTRTYLHFYLHIVYIYLQWELASDVLKELLEWIDVILLTHFDVQEGPNVIRLVLVLNSAFPHIGLEVTPVALDCLSVGASNGIDEILLVFDSLMSISIVAKTIVRSPTVADDLSSCCDVGLNDGEKSGLVLLIVRALEHP